MNESKQIVRQPAVQARGNAAVTHPVNPAARRRTSSLGDATGLTLLGIHINVIEPGATSTEQHRHACADEFIFVLSGQGTVSLDGNSHEVSAGDFIGFPANGPAHAMVNTGTDELVYLVGGNRPPVDVCDFPRQGKRLYIFQAPEGRRYDLVDTSDLKPLTR